MEPVGEHDVPRAVGGIHLVAVCFDPLRSLQDAATTILLVDQNARAALSIADRAYVLEVGRIALSGRGDELLVNPAVQQAYLGL